uniref:RWD domain-containing protein n=1 Tax=Angiostrongylus cantonensis TaxID=6313 RepID=A0A158P840_ANGCA
MNSEADYQKMTIAHLKDELSKRGITPDPKAKKSELIKLLQKVEDLLNDDVLNDVLPEKLISDVSKPVKATTEVNSVITTESEKERPAVPHDPLALDVRLKRAQRFGLPISVTDPLAKAKRAERFGINSLSSNESKAKRAERFGLNKEINTVNKNGSCDEETRRKLLNRAERFGLPVNKQGKTLTSSKDILTARAERFGLKTPGATNVGFFYTQLELLYQRRSRAKKESPSVEIGCECFKLQMEADVEVEALRAIFGDEITIESNLDNSLTIVRKKVRPNDQEGVSSASVVVEFELGTKARFKRIYPEIPPEVRLVSPRGISDESHRQLIEEINRMISGNVGSPIMFDVFQSSESKEVITESFGLGLAFEAVFAQKVVVEILDGVVVSSTPCDHYAHSDCLDLHVEYTRKQLGEKLSARQFKMCDDIDKSLRCPVCRVMIEEEIDPILPSSSHEHKQTSSQGDKSPHSSSQQESHSEFDFDWEKWRQQQASLMVIYKKQKEKGGIIDLEEERKKTLVTEDTVKCHMIANLGCIESLHGESAYQIQYRIQTLLSAAALDVSASFVDAAPTNSCLDTMNRENCSSNRDTNNVRRINEHAEGVYRKKGHRGGEKRAFSKCTKKYALAMPDASVSKLKSTRALTGGPRHDYNVQRSDRHIVSGLTRGQHRGSSLHQSDVTRKESKSMKKSTIELCDVHE